MAEFTHGGNVRKLAEAAGCAPEEILDFSASINPLGPPPWFRDVISAHTSGLVHYPDPDCAALVRAACERFGCGADEVAAGNGSTEILYALVRALEPQRAVIPVPAYTDYKRACVQQGVPVDTLALFPENDFVLDFEELIPLLSPGSLVFLGQPNNPTGCAFSPQALREVARQHSKSWFAVDEAFADFVPGLDLLSRDRPHNVIALYSLTKFFAMPGLRLGLGFAHPGLCEKIREKIPPWSVNALALAVGAKALLDKEYLVAGKKRVAGLRQEFFAGLGQISGITVFPGQANFLLCRVDKQGLDAERLAKGLLESKIAVRVCRDFEGLDGRYFRVAVRTHEQNVLFLEKLREILGQPQKPSRIKRPVRPPAIMLQGVGSNAGKSVLACALCRIFFEDGFSVAPFKSQNMSLNSFVTRDGLEMGRAQVTQSQAAGLEPDARMNPVLLKPSSDTGSQVIVMGRPVSNMDVSAYIKYKPQAFAEAKKAYDELCQGRDVMVLEGAGSPAEINLKAHDIVNMRMAEYAKAKVLLAGDIDRGGVFAALTGTMELLQEWERAHVSGFVINRFRGDESLLRDALVQISARTGKPFFGVVPYIR
ncbi:MAG: cobyric acid synthase, partial [Thermodesulfobacteriota bacterium]|nr:cobyric acid synthase [Thermodesulfobacteriota bacterium]